METQRILVTGGSGFIGTNLVNELRSRGHEVLAVDLLHHEGEADLYSDSYSDYVRGDVRSYRQMERIFEDNDDFDYVYHLAAEYGRWNGEGYYENLWETNVIGLKNMIRLQEKQAVHRLGHGAVVHVDIPHSARHLAADAQQDVSLADGTVADHDVLARRIQPPRIPVAPRLDDDGIVTLVKGAALHEEVAAHLEVYPVVIVPMRLHVEVAHDAAVAQVEVDGPERALAYLESVEQDVVATVEVDEVRTQVVLAARHLAVLHRDVGRSHGVELCWQRLECPSVPSAPSTVGAVALTSWRHCSVKSLARLGRWRCAFMWGIRRCVRSWWPPALRGSIPGVRKCALLIARTTISSRHRSLVTRRSIAARSGLLHCVPCTPSCVKVRA